MSAKPIGPGDLCIVVKAANPVNLHIVVRVVGLPNPGLNHFPDGSLSYQYVPTRDGEIVLVQSQGRKFVTKTRERGVPTEQQSVAIAPWALKRLGDDEGADETLAWTPVPALETLDA